MEKKFFLLLQKQAREIFESTAQYSSQPYVIHRWLGGMLTNNETIKSSGIKNERTKENGRRWFIIKITKKRSFKYQKRTFQIRKKPHWNFNMNKKPGALFVVDIKREHLALAS